MKHKFTFKPKTIFWALVVVFVVIVGDMFVPILTSTFPALRAYLIPLMFISWAAFFALGLALIVLIVRKKAEGLQGSLKKFLLLTGASAVGFLPFVVLHNAVYGLFGVEESFFFILAVFVCPLGFLVGVIGTIVLIIKKRGKK